MTNVRDVARAAVVVAIVLSGCVGAASGDVFGTGANQFTIDFVTISGSTNPASGIPAGSGFTFTGIANDYRMGTCEITNGQWDKFTASLGVPVTGSPSIAYDDGPYFTAANVPTNNVSWYEAAQFVNWLNTSTGHQAAYKFTGAQGTGDYTLATWSTAEADGGTNLYRHKDAKYYLPTENEWVKAGYWNGTSLQTYATKAGETLHQGDGTSGTGWNYYGNGYATDPYGPWAVGTGSQELNGTYDMMGNVWEWMENSHSGGDYGDGTVRGLRSGSYYLNDYYLASSYRTGLYPGSERLREGVAVQLGHDRIRDVGDRRHQSSSFAAMHGRARSLSCTDRFNFSRSHVWAARLRIASVLPAMMADDASSALSNFWMSQITSASSTALKPRKPYCTMGCVTRLSTFNPPPPLAACEPEASGGTHR